jgi:hypothetical protein
MMRGIGLATMMAPVAAVSGDQETPVDLALVLAVDVSSSMNEREQQAQREGYVAAFRSQDVVEAIESGARGRIAVAYVEWAGSHFHAMRVPWTIVAGAAEATAFADRLAAAPFAVERATSISAGLAFAAAALSIAPEADRAVIDISGDGPNNAGPAVPPLRDALVSQGIVINGLAIDLPRSGDTDLADTFGPGFIRAYYEDCVVGGAGAFVIAVDDVAAFERAILEKLVLEIAGLRPGLIPAGYRSGGPSVDCASVGAAPGR